MGANKKLLEADQPSPIQGTIFRAVQQTPGCTPAEASDGAITFVNAVVIQEAQTAIATYRPFPQTHKGRRFLSPLLDTGHKKIADSVFGTRDLWPGGKGQKWGRTLLER